MEIENILFDFNGTIVNDLDLCLELLNTMLKMRNHLPVSKEKYLEIFDFPVIEYYKKAGFLFPKDDFPQLANFFIKEYEQRNVECPLQEHLEEVLTYFINKQKKLYIVSASEKQLLLSQLKKYRIDKYFLGVSGLDNINAGSKIESAKSFMNKMKFDLHKTIFIGDTLHDKEVADALNVECILISKGHQSRARLEKAGCKVIDDMLELKAFIK